MCVYVIAVAPAPNCPISILTIASPAKVDKLAILGIRSFDNTRQETIAFHTPLTLIVGYNGSGKTTIIECLKYATTGDLPPNSKNGAFIHDPKICGEKEVMAQVKLSFVNTNGARMVCTRSLQLTVKKTTRTQKTLDGQLLMYKDNQRSTVSTKCVELDTMLPNFLGVSRSVLDNVIFCHQEESMWPLSEASVLKKKFDEIFEAQKYTKAIDNIKALRKKQAEEIKYLTLQQSQFKSIKDSAEKAERKTKEISARIDTLREEYDQLFHDMGKSSDELKAHQKTSAGFERVLALLEARRGEAQNAEERIIELEDGIDLLSDSDEVLEDRLANFKAEMDKFEDRIDVQEQEKYDLREEQGRLRSRLSKKSDQKGTLQARKAHYEEQLVNRESMIKEASILHEIRGFGAGDLDDRQVTEFMAKIERLNREQIGNFERAKKEGREEQLQASNALSSLNQKHSSLEQTKQFAGTEISRLNDELRMLQKGLDRLQVDEGRITKLEIVLGDVNSKLVEMNDHYTQQQWDHRIQAKDTEIREVEDNISRETKELTKGTAEADSKAKLSILQKEVETKKSAQESLILANTDKFDRLLGKWDLMTLDDDFHDILEQKEEEVTKATRLLDSSNSELTQTESQLKTQRDMLKRKNQEFERAGAAVARAMKKDTFAECADYPTQMREMEEDMENAQRDGAMAEQTKLWYDKALKVAHEKQCCRMCRRGYSDEEDLHAFIGRLEQELEKMADPSVIEKEIRQIADDLRGLKEVSLDFEIATKIQEQELPQINGELARLEKKQETLLAAFELRKKEQDDKVAKRREVEGLRNPVSEILKYDKDVRDNQHQINSLVKRLEAMGSSRSVHDIQKALQSLNEQATKLKGERNTLWTDKEAARTELVAAERQLQEHQNQLVSARHEFEKKQTQAKRLADCNDLIHQRQQQISEADSEVKTIQPQIIKARAREAEVRQMWEEREQSLQRLAHKSSDTFRALKSIQATITQYESGDTVEMLATLVRESAELEAKIGEIEDQVTAAETRLVELRAQRGKADNFKRSIQDNLRLRKSKEKLAALLAEIRELEAQDAAAERDRFKVNLEKLQRKYEAQAMARTGKGAEIKTLDVQLKGLLTDYEVDFRDARKNFHEGQIRLQTTTVANEDLGKYQAIYGRAVMKYHSLKMEEVNRIIDDLWKKTYKGTDVDTILIRSEQENAKGNRLYNYRVCMLKQDAELDMRGRCSAGQKVLASIIIRLALAECFGTNCGLIALDEPTTNLDRDNSRALAQSLHDIINYRQAQKNFQLIVITHDEEFLRDMKCNQFTEYYYRVSRNERQKSQIHRQSIAELIFFYLINRLRKATLSDKSFTMRVGFIATSLLAACASAAPVLQLRNTGAAFEFSRTVVRGVNLGGWLLLEPWIRPSLWSQWDSNPEAGPKDEYNWCRVLGRDECSRRLQAHWSSWYTEQDFRDMKTVGLNTVRIPIGYWAFQPLPGDPYVQGQVQWLDTAIQWARNCGLAVWIDLHGAPGSQNGFDNSGLRDQIRWQTTPDYVVHTIKVIQQIAAKYTQPEYQGVVAVIELLNEPLGPALDVAALRQFHWDGLGSVRAVGTTWLSMSDAFLHPSQWNPDFNGDSNHMVNGKYANVILDHHHYQVFSPGENSRDLNTQLTVACRTTRDEILGANKYVVVGEWSGAMTDCARWLNGYGRGARYDGTYQNGQAFGSCATKGTISQMSWSQKQEWRMYIEAQLITYEMKPSRGWIFWTWKAEPGNNNDDWNMSALLSRSIFPKPVTDIRYKDICNGRNGF
ncbi:DNA repair protein rad50 [Drechslerella dactyloides]|uniref:DNA repair protein RAD50 n=1 Tax=Drechslerella dactyloides TaxID=74499 RepID=A0AAD6IZQ2_DREDA|nr:DNA repair protein rad50 [Drechslerella dactyloides]